jgi:hypothetical protein
MANIDPILVHPEQTVRLDVELLRSSTVIPAAPMHTSTSDPAAKTT